MYFEDEKEKINLNQNNMVSKICSQADLIKYEKILEIKKFCSDKNC